MFILLCSFSILLSFAAKHLKWNEKYCEEWMHLWEHAPSIGTCRSSRSTFKENGRKMARRRREVRLYWPTTMQHL